MFNIISNFISRIADIDKKYDAEIAEVKAAEKATMDKIEANHKQKMAEMKAAHQRELQRIKNMPKPVIVKDDAAIRKHKELTTRFEALMAKHGH